MIRQFKIMIFFLFFSLTASLLGELLSGNRGCKMECPKGQVPAIKEKYHFNSNGCGYGAMDVGGAFDFSPCCDLHDVCYTLCGAKHSFCEKKFGQCQEKICDSQE